MRILTREGMQKLENQTAASGKTTLGEMMRLAGSGSAQLICSRYDVGGKRTAIVCGSGNNGGDGFICADRLARENARVTVILACGAPKTQLAAGAFAEMPKTVTVIDCGSRPQEADEAILAADFLIDAVFGFGFHGELKEDIRPLFRKMNESGAVKVSLDLPSGVAADTGRAAQDAFRADLTAAFTALKPAHVLPKSRDYCGEVQVIPVGIDSSETGGFEDYEVLDLPAVKADWKPRAADSHKGTYGRLFAAAGSFGMAGAAIMAVRAALRSGVGLVELAAEKDLYPVLAPALPEAVFCLMSETDLQPAALAAQRADAVLIGCGLSRDTRAKELLRISLENAGGPVVLDADGINLVSEDPDLLRLLRRPLVLTPHPKEAAGLLGTDVREIQSDRRTAAKMIAEKTNAVCVLKGSGTVIASPDGDFCLNVTGNPGMAKGGSGDVLAGIIGSLLAQGTEPFRAAALGAYIHGLAGDICAGRFSQTAMLPTDLIGTLPEVFREIERTGAAEV